MEIKGKKDLIFSLLHSTSKELAAAFVDSFKNDKKWKEKLKSKHFCQMHLQAFIYALYNEDKAEDTIKVLRNWLLNETEIDFVPNEEYNDYITQIIYLLPDVLQVIESKKAFNLITIFSNFVNDVFENHLKYPQRKLNKVTWYVSMKAIFEIVNQTQTSNISQKFIALFIKYYFITYLDNMQSREIIENFLEYFSKGNVQMEVKLRQFISSLFKSFFSFPTDPVERNFIVHSLFVTREMLKDDKKLGEYFFQIGIDTIISKFSNLDDQYVQTFNLDFVFEIFSESIFNSTSEMDDFKLADKINSIAKLCSLVSLGQFNELSKWEKKFIKYLKDQFLQVIIPNINKLIVKSHVGIGNLDTRLANLIARKPNIGFELKEIIINLASLSEAHWIYTLTNFIENSYFQVRNFIKEMKDFNSGKEMKVDFDHLVCDLQCLVHCALMNEPILLCNIAQYIAYENITKEMHDSPSCLKPILMLPFAKSKLVNSVMEIFRLHLSTRANIKKSEPYIISVCIVFIELSYNSTSLLFDPYSFSNLIDIMSIEDPHNGKRAFSDDFVELTLDNLRTIPTDPSIANELLKQCSKVKTYSVCNNSILTFGETDSKDKYIAIIRGRSGIKAFELKNIPNDPKNQKQEEPKNKILTYSELGLEKPSIPFEEYPQMPPYSIDNPAITFLINLSAFHNIKYVENPDFTEYDKNCEPLLYKISFVSFDNAYNDLHVFDNISKQIRRTARASFEVVYEHDDDAIITVVFMNYLPGLKLLVDESDTSKKIFISPCGNFYRVVCNHRFNEFERNINANKNSKDMSINDFPIRRFSAKNCAEFIRIYAFLSICSDGYEPEKKLPKFADDMMKQDKRRKEELAKLMKLGNASVNQDPILDELNELPNLF
ncbi:hypothetical protein TVAG_120700 [Trichomonas vaginalis G3]|uniref:Uncharacterized protein n=1 Tax=Trichomonas vaginalis (strain ATCC PRA-98 / G3) TaxID=412133 RepID=A2D7L5_TRIV3|nr:hypothetical protein TVAGG3_0993800 [Trichomonas vaginalis G3]EAY23732.1 hypothetical protein TVAG_120700 [Trichomonas vaginalis G3]KAI5490227.1 hypothetical protein TVAGG3_0993800 [Trichomonas vaginalis G3]|eukprot:XP_001276980.1 hypothetical protein [Trichomonas vaginalis G3]